jgi:DnaJ-class molecular chaperone
MAKDFLGGYNTYDTSNGFGNKAKWQKAFQQRMTKDDARALLKEKAETPYSLLGVEATASQDAIKKAFRKLIMQWHPDRNADRLQEAEEMTKKLIAAYTLLTA